MKKLLFAAALLVASHTCSAQTTQEEYMYATRGYVDVLTKGYDGKADYNVTLVLKGDYVQNLTANYHFKYYHLIKKSTNKIQGTIVILFRNEVVENVLCIPLSNSDAGLLSSYKTLANGMLMQRSYLIANYVSELSKLYSDLIPYKVSLKDFKFNTTNP